MAIAVGSVSNTPTFATRVNSTITAPSSIANGNLLVAVLNVGDASALPALTVTPPAGFTEVTNSPTAAADVDPYTVTTHVYWKVAASEAGNYTFTHTSAATEGYMYRLTGANTTTPIDATPTVQVWASGQGQTTTYPSVTTVTNGCFLIFAECLWDAVGAGTVSGTTPSITLRRAGTLQWIGDGTQTTAGATGSRTRSTNGNGSVGTKWASIVVPIRPSTGPAAYTMPAVNGTLTAAGQANRLARSRDMDAVNGTLTLAGPTVNLIYSGAGSKSMPGGIGFLAVSGQTAILRRIRIMPAVQGTLTAAGQVAALRYAHKVPAGQAALTPSGQNVTLRYTRKMPAGLGTITVLEPVVNLIYSGAGVKLLPAGVGFPRLDGQPVTLRYTRKLVAANGLLVLYSQPATLTHAEVTERILTAAPGVIGLTGCDVTLSRTRRPPVMVQETLKFGRPMYINRW
jgi:hypothetical protein